MIKLDDNAQPIAQSARTKSHKKQAGDRPPTLSKNGLRVGRPRKNVGPEQGPENHGAGSKTLLAHGAHSIERVRKEGQKSLKRKRSPNPSLVEEANDKIDADESDMGNEEGSIYSFRESDEEVETIPSDSAGEVFRPSRGRRGKRKGKGGNRARSGRNIEGRPGLLPADSSGDTPRIDSGVQQEDNSATNGDVVADYETLPQWLRPLLTRT